MCAREGLPHAEFYGSLRSRAQQPDTSGFASCVTSGLRLDPYGFRKRGEIPLQAVVGLQIGVTRTTFYPVPGTQPVLSKY